MSVRTNTVVKLTTREPRETIVVAGAAPLMGVASPLAMAPTVALPAERRCSATGPYS